MKRVVLALLSLACATLVAGGCAKQELVKKDDQLAAAPAAAKPVKELPRPEQTAQQTPGTAQTSAQQAKVKTESRGR